MRFKRLQKFKEQNRLTHEIAEMQRFLGFLVETGRDFSIGQYPRKEADIHILEDFSSISRPRESMGHFYEIHEQYKFFRERALNCQRCQRSLDAILLFKAVDNKEIFTGELEEARRILLREYERGIDKNVFIGGLPVYSENISPRARIVYITSLSIEQGAREFRDKIALPLKLNLSKFSWKKKIARGGEGTPYYQANTHHTNGKHQTYISIRSIKREK